MTQEQIAYTIFAVFSFILGAVLGSFLNVCVHRLPRGESVVSPPSRCPKCMNRITWYDNIPILSWLFLGARCRHCGEPISWQYPLVEALTGTLFLLVFWRFGFTIAAPVYMVLAASLVLVTFIDLTDWTIPNEVTLPGIPISILLAVVATIYPASGLVVLGPGAPVFSSLIGVAAGGLVLFLLDQATLLILKKPGMGFGDVKLLAMLGGFFGWPGVIMMLIVASLVGSVVGVIAILATRKRAEPASAGPEEGAEQPARPDANDEDEVISIEGHYLPFGPYLCLAGIVVMLAGEQIYQFYLTIANI